MPRGRSHCPRGPNTYAHTHTVRLIKYKSPDDEAQSKIDTTTLTVFAQTNYISFVSQITEGERMKGEREVSEKRASEDWAIAEPQVNSRRYSKSRVKYKQHIQTHMSTTHVPQRAHTQHTALNTRFAPEGQIAKGRAS